MGGKQSSPFSKELENYRIISKNQENNITYLAHKETDKEYLLREMTFNDQNVYLSSMDVYKKRNNLSPDHLTHLIRHQGREIDHLCSNVYKVYALWEYPYRFLAEQIKDRAPYGRKFQQKELWSIFASCIFGMSTLQQNKIKHESLTTKSIVLDNQGIIKVCDPLTTNKATNFDRIYNNRRAPENISEQTIYLSPEQCQALDNRSTYSNSYKNDIYVMAIILLQCGLLKPQYSLYRNQFEKINNQNLYASLDQFSKEYGREFRNMLELMLKSDEKDRPDWIDLKRYARKQGTDAQTFENQRQVIEYPKKQQPNIVRREPQPHIVTNQQLPTVSPQKVANAYPSHTETYFSPNVPKNIQQPMVQISGFPETQSFIHTNKHNVNQQYNFNQPNLNHHPLNQHNFNQNTINQHPNINWASNTYQNHQNHMNLNYPPRTHEHKHQPLMQQLLPNNIGSYQSKPIDNESIFTDPKLLMMVRGQTPLSSTHHAPPASSNIQNTRSVYEPNSIQTPSTEAYQNGYLFPNNVKQEQRQTYIQSEPQNITSNYNREQSQNRKKSDQWSQEKIPKNTIQSVNTPTIQNQLFQSQKPLNNNVSNNQDDKLQYVIETFRQGSRYEGYKLNDQRHGNGKFYYLDGGLYDGNWRYNKMDGQGSLYYQSGKLAYQGNWCDDKFQGFGILYNEYPVDLRQEGIQNFDYTNFDGIDDYWERYEGRFEEDFKKGKGKLILANGQWFQGQFVDDMVQGSGTFHRLDGSSVQGVWRENHLDETY